MSIFPDDDKKKREAENPADKPAPKPNPSNAFKGGAIREGRDKIRDGRGKIRADAAKSASGSGRGCAIFFIITVPLLIGGVLLFTVFAPMFGWFNIYGEDTRAVPGDAAAFDPIAAYAEIAAYARGEAAEIEFIDMEAYYVKSDGTLDLYADYRPRVEWDFVIAAPRPENAPPVGAGGSPTDRYFQHITVRAFTPGQIRSVSRTSGGSSVQYTYKHLGLEKDVDDPSTSREAATLPPTCSFKTLWDIAITRGAPAEAVAVIDYDNGQYSFSIRDTDVRLTFNADCEIVR